jgi:hypothetical protein
MCDHQFEVHNVFDFSQNDTDFTPSARFANHLLHSHCPFIILLVGNGRVGKSTRANQILTHKLNEDEPFLSDSGLDPVTTKFQYVGPIKFSQLSEIHEISIMVDSDPDIFLIDCEGLHSLGVTTPVLKQATFALSQMSSMTVLVMKDQVNHENIENVRSLFVLSRAFSSQLPGFVVGTSIIMRDVGVKYPKGQKLKLDEKNRLRKEADNKARQMILPVLKDEGLELTEDNMMVLAQPCFHETEMYWKSIEDLLNFAANIAKAKANISGESLLQLFDEAKPSIMAIQDFSNPTLPFEQILRNVIGRYFRNAITFVTRQIENESAQSINQWTIEQLQAGLNIHFVGNMTIKYIGVFEHKAKELFPPIFSLASDECKEKHLEIEQIVSRICNDLFVNRCIAILLPDNALKLLNKIKQEIDIEITSLEKSSIGAFPFSSLLNQYIVKAESQFRNIMSQIHLEIPRTSDFNTSITKLQNDISKHMEQRETEAKAVFEKYLQEQREAERKEQQAEFEQNLKIMSETQAKQLAQEREEKVRASEELKRKEMEHEYALKLQKADLEHKIEQEKETMKIMLAMQEKQKEKEAEMAARLEEQEKRSQLRLQEEQQRRMNQERAFFDQMNRMIEKNNEFQRQSYQSQRGGYSEALEGRNRELAQRVDKLTKDVEAARRSNRSQQKKKSCSVF